MSTYVRVLRTNFQQGIKPLFLSISVIIHNFCEIVYNFIPRPLWKTIFLETLIFQRFQAVIRFMYISYPQLCSMIIFTSVRKAETYDFSRIRADMDYFTA